MTQGLRAMSCADKNRYYCTTLLTEMEVSLHKIVQLSHVHSETQQKKRVEVEVGRGGDDRKGTGERGHGQICSLGG